MKQRFFLLLVPTILCLFLIACSPERPISPSTPNASQELSVSVSSTVEITPTLQQYESEIEFMKGFGNAWSSQNPDELLPYYSKDVKAFDAGSYHVTYTYTIIENVVSTHVKNGDFYFELNSFFITDNGNFSAFIGTFLEKNGNGYTSIPAMSMLEILDGQVIWEYDYYAGSFSETYPLPEIPISASKHTLSEEESANIKSNLMNWKLAFNNYDLDTLSTFYSDQASCINMIAPEWVVQTKSQMLDNLDEKFSDENLSVIIEDFFVSANGQYAAVQGEVKLIDETPQPIIMLLEIKDGEIIQQYLYLDDPVYYEIFE
jgi:ketosteroid isomerase-like protein